MPCDLAVPDACVAVRENEAAAPKGYTCVASRGEPPGTKTGFCCRMYTKSAWRKGAPSLSNGLHHDIQLKGAAVSPSVPLFPFT